ncbi:MAG: glycosyltransferase family 2 protein [bacterium]|nr:glycosyltransferase family 2 protein [bacterium]
MSEVEISIVVPVKDEAESVADLAREIREVMNTLPYTWECVWVNDGSTDGTLAVLLELQREEGRFRVVDLARNYGQSGALMTGLRRARGAILATLDGDGQNDPHDFPALLARLAEGDVAMVNGVRVRRQDSWVRRVSSWIANKVRNWFLHDGVSDTGCALRVFRRECVEGIPVFKGTHRFLPALAVMRGYRITEMAVNHRPRRKGVTKYGVRNRIWVGLADLWAVCWMRRRLVYPEIRAEYPAVET